MLAGLAWAPSARRAVASRAGARRPSIAFRYPIRTSVRGRGGRAPTPRPAPGAWGLPRPCLPLRSFGPSAFAGLIARLCFFPVPTPGEAGSEGERWRGGRDTEAEGVERSGPGEPRCGGSSRAGRNSPSAKTLFPFPSRVSFFLLLSLVLFFFFFLSNGAPCRPRGPRRGPLPRADPIHLAKLPKLCTIHCGEAGGLAQSAGGPPSAARRIRPPVATPCLRRPRALRAPRRPHELPALAWRTASTCRFPDENPARSGARRGCLNPGARERVRAAECWP